jgi:NAD(P)H dehydrogenase (quinone)
MPCADRILLISANEPGRRARQHENAIDAAARAEHQATEAALRASGLTYSLLRNSWYVENYTAQVPAIRQCGTLAGSAGDGLVSAATRADYAAAAAAVQTGDGHENRAYELGGDEAFTLAELAAEIGAQAGQPVSYLDLPEDEYARLLAGAGLPEGAAVTLADADRGLARGDLFVDSGHLRQLIGRPTTTLREAVTAALR